MNAVEIRNLSKSFRGMYAVDHLNMTVPAGPFTVSSEKTAAANPQRKKWFADCSRLPLVLKTVRMEGGCRGCF